MNEDGLGPVCHPDQPNEGHANGHAEPEEPRSCLAAVKQSILAAIQDACPFRGLPLLVASSMFL